MRTTANYFNLGRIILLIVAVILVGQTLFAQTPPKPPSSPNKPDDKIHIKVEIDKDGTKQTFSKEYKNLEEMKTDPQLHKLEGNLMPPQPWMDFNEDSLFAKNHRIDIDSMIEGEMGKKIRHFHLAFDDSMVPPPFPPAPIIDNSLIRIQKMIPDSISRVLPPETWKNFELLDSEFGTTGRKIVIEDFDIKKSSLKLHNFSYFNNNGKIRLRFTTEVQAPITIKIFDEKSNMVFMDKVSNGQGHFNKQIDLSDKTKGKYLMLVEQQGKKMKKRILIE